MELGDVGLGDVTRFGVSREDVRGNYIEGDSFVALMGSAEHIVSVGLGKRPFMEAIMHARYGGFHPSERQRRLEIDLARAREGDRIYCQGAEDILFPDPNRPPIQNYEPRQLSFRW